MRLVGVGRLDGSTGVPIPVTRRIHMRHERSRFALVRETVQYRRRRRGEDSQGGAQGQHLAGDNAAQHDRMIPHGERPGK